jgi:methyl-accepting chemotaxis protein
MTGFVPFADMVIRPMLDRFTGEDAAIVGCCLIDRNGHLPTHISARSQAPRPADRQWNLEHARNRQIFMDRQTREALDRDGDYFLFTYRQDFGDGRYRALRSVFVPLLFGGRKWGLYEVGYLI